MTAGTASSASWSRTSLAARGRRDTDRAPGPPAHGPARRGGGPGPGTRGRAWIPSGPSSSGSGSGSARSSSGPAGRARDDARALRFVVFWRPATRSRRSTRRRHRPASTSRPTASRRLARTLAPGYSGDPLDTRTRRIPKLQELFRFRDPDGPAAADPPEAGGGSRSWLPSWLAPSPAHADEADEWRELSERLDRWVPASRRAPRTRRSSIAHRSPLSGPSTGEALDARFDDLFRDLVKTVAWQEKLLAPVRPRPERGRPDPVLHGDFGHDADQRPRLAGLLQPGRSSAGAPATTRGPAPRSFGSSWALRESARPRAPLQRGPLVVLRRITAAHGATAATDRPTPPPEMRLVDQAFWEKYQAVSAGQAGDRVLCMPVRRT